MAASVIAMILVIVLFLYRWIASHPADIEYFELNLPELLKALNDETIRYGYVKSGKNDVKL